MVQKIETQAQALSARPPNPYVGPRAFKEGERLFGRDREAGELLDIFISQRIVLLYSPSGAGKSSLVEAVLKPALRKNGFRVLPTVRVNLPPEVGDRESERFVLSTNRSLAEQGGERATMLREVGTGSVADQIAAVRA